MMTMILVDMICNLSNFCSVIDMSRSTEREVHWSNTCQCCWNFRQGITQYFFEAYERQVKETKVMRCKKKKKIRTESSDRPSSRPLRTPYQSSSGGDHGLEFVNFRVEFKLWLCCYSCGTRWCTCLRRSARMPSYWYWTCEDLIH